MAMFPSYRNQSNYLQCKSNDCFLHDGSIERLRNLMFISIVITAFTSFSVFYLLNRILQTIAKTFSLEELQPLFTAGIYLLKVNN